MVEKRVLGIDIESYCDLDIGAVGSFRYVDDPSFEITLFGYGWDGAPSVCVDLLAGETVPEEVVAALTSPDVLKTGWNNAFERYALWKHFGTYLPPEQWEDTMVLAAQCGLPLKLETCGEALKLAEDKAKLKEGKDLIRYFCTPCKPTKNNGYRTRNLPEHDPEKWRRFKAYNCRDVDSEGTIRSMLLSFKPTEIEHRFWCLDARINERGVLYDPVLAQAAIELDEANKAELIRQAVELTGIQNPNSTAQVKAWLHEQEDIEVVSLNKKVVGDVISQLTQENTLKFMQLRADISKSSVSKYAAMVRSANPKDEHIRGCTQFYGAHRTGRFAGRIVQLQNLPQNHIPDLALARSLVRAKDAEAVELLYDGISDTLSQLIRTALIPEPGQRFIVSDFSAIEARVIAWFANEKWRLEVFENGGDIYCQSASQMFKVPVEKHGQNAHLRQKGKVAELACIAEGELVLTDKGLFPIVDVTRDMKVWDGEAWVSHEGVIFRGYKEVLTYDGLTATPDHLVWVEGQPEPLQFGVAASSGARLVQTGDGGHPIRLGEDHQPGETLGRELEPLLCADTVHGLREDPVDEPWQPAARQVEGLSELLGATASISEVAGQTTHSSETALHEPEGSSIQRIRCPRDRVSVSVGERGLPVHNGDLWDTGAQHGDRPDQHERSLRTGEPSVCHTVREPSEPAADSSVGVGPAVLALRTNSSHPEAIGRYDQRTSHTGSRESGTRKEKELAWHSSKVAVYDIRNAGPHHRFTVSGKLVHNCGYGGGVNALIQFGADKMGMTDEEMAETVAMWRDASPNICRLWKSLENAAIKAITRNTSTVSSLGGVQFDYERGILWMNLPSGRRIAYWDCKYAPSKWKKGKRAISYMGLNDKKKWSRIETWGGKLVENLVQATARDCLRDKMLALDAAGFDIRFHVHDEVVVTEPRDGKTLEEMNAIMNEPLPWAPGLPLRGDGYYCDFYQKD